MSKKYYLSDNDFIYCEEENKQYEYHYIKKTFVPTDTIIDPIKFHKFPESELEESLKIREHLFYNKIGK